MVRAASRPDRAGRRVTAQVGRWGRTVNEVAVELRYDWHTVNDAVMAYGTALVDDHAGRIGEPIALGLDETLFVRDGPRRSQRWSTSIVDVGAGRLLDVVRGPAASSRAGRWLLVPRRGGANIEWATLDVSGPYRAVFDTMLPDATQVADRFHLVGLANAKLDERRRRVQNDTLGHRGRNDDPLHRCRRLLTRADERLDDNVAPASSVSLMPVIPTAKCAPPGTPRKWCGGYTTTPTPSPQSPSSTDSGTICKTTRAPSRRVDVAPCVLLGAPRERPRGTDVHQEGLSSCEYRRSMTRNSQDLWIGFLV
jgi:hypothetical protein